ncbi:histidine kinase [Roseateles asaccharophilus]|uniref:Signal transduction histidine kinase n=1 Tax=Roseateles asaccharophilus TaxID=582607 RepID=A0ABU2AFJ5_9BURK|nr:histidine kinase [Roseateles asaccharophilus]MDR7335972.1 signal transduction histidine kinase [Roseateles asaccharophilus]
MGLLVIGVLSRVFPGARLAEFGTLAGGFWGVTLALAYVMQGGGLPGYSRDVGMFASYRQWTWQLTLLLIYVSALLVGIIPLVVDGVSASASKFMLLVLLLVPALLPFDACSWWLARHVGDRPTMQQALSMWLPALLVSMLACLIVMKVIQLSSAGLFKPVHFFFGLAAGPLYLLTLVVLHRATLSWHARIGQADQRADAADTARHLAEARLAVLQAQIEPHFLFNTLATVEYLIKSEPDKAGVLLNQLTRYLRLAMPSMRQLSSTLGREFELTDAYLQIARLRMGGRLQVDVELPDALLTTGFPALVVQTLVENAIKHGVEPKPGPAHIRVFARQVGSELHVGVQDNGVGLSGVMAPDGGTGLQNVRERLRGLHGERAQLSVVGLADGGVLATVVVPLEKETA